MAAKEHPAAGYELALELKADREVTSVTLICGDSMWEHAISWLIRSAGIEIAARGRDVERAPELVATHASQVLVVNVDDDLEPGRLHKRLKDVARLRPKIEIVVVCGAADNASRDAALAAGASRVAPRENALDILHAIELARWESGHETRERPRLTLREVEVLRIVADGRTTREAARLMWVTEQTVKYHLACIYRKLGVHSREAAVSWAEENGVAGRLGTSG